VQGTPLVEMSPADFERPVLTAVWSMFLTLAAAARHLLRQGSGVILVFGGYLMGRRTAEAPAAPERDSATAVRGIGKVPVGTAGGRP
jgi:NAD(P)-dependent dehydrogenase (short-subunit alcohol dehydrogenase family)